MKKSNLSLIIAIVIGLILIAIIWYFALCDTTFIVNKNNIELVKGSSEKIDYQLSHTLKSVTWSSSNDEIASVSQTGVITANGYGFAIITGTIMDGDNVISNDVLVTCYGGVPSINLDNVNVKSDFSISLQESVEVPIEFIPDDAYIQTIEYKMDKDGIIEINGQRIIGLQEGIVNVEVTVNSLFTKKMRVRVLDTSVSRKNVEELSFEKEIITLDLGEEEDINYIIKPDDAYVYDVKWATDNSEIINLDNGVVKAKSYGTTNVSLTVNGDLTKIIEVVVSKPTSGITLHSSSKIITKIGITNRIVASVLPADATQRLRYTSSDNNILEVSDKGEIIAKAVGTGTIKLETEDRKNSKEIPFIVHPNVGVVEGDGGIWGYQSDISYVPIRADQTFFSTLANQGKGSLNNDVYTYSNYSYDIKKSTFYYDGKSTLMRFYYPPNVDLSELNTFTFLGGAGERNFNGYFANINNNTEILKSKGILILLSARTDEGYNPNLVIACTNFVKEIVEQKSTAMNSVGGYSLGGPDAGRAAEKGDYKKLMIFDSYFDEVNSNVNLKEKQIIFYSPAGDSMYSRTVSALNSIKKNGTYKNVTIISNNKELINNYQNDFLIINPGSIMGNGHGNTIITKASYFMFGCD